MKLFIPCTVTLGLIASTIATQDLQFSPVGEDPIPAILAEVSPERLMGHVEKLVSFHTRHTFSETESDERGIGAARRWLKSEFQAIAKQTGGRLEVREQRFVQAIRGQEVELVTVYGFLPGTAVEPEGRTYVVSGHYDSRASDAMDATSFAPGADDDASGTAVVLELARVMSGHEYAANLVFMCVPAEEQGLYGAAHFAEEAEAQPVFVDGMLTNDIVGGVEGGNGVRDDVTIRCFSDAEGLHSTSRELARAVRASAVRYVPDANVSLIFRLDRFGRGGDHKPFHERGFPAVRMTEANEFYERQHQDVREEDGVQYGDLLKYVSGPYMGKVTRVDAAVLAELALAPAPPTGLSMRAAVSYDTQLSWEPDASGQAAAYEVVWRATTAPDWEHSRLVANEVSEMRSRRGTRQVVSTTIEGVTADGYFFGVRSVSAGGHRSRVTYPNRP
ncbi:MAG: hypothetical protein ACI8QS_000705 [Planctomycetota bacterium]|jgi:hypothetical protein